jgi:hypothetical protein
MTVIYSNQLSSPLAMDIIDMANSTRTITLQLQKTRRSVRFATFSEGKIIDPPTDEDIRNTIYSKADTRQFKQQLQRDVRRMAYLLDTSPTGSIPRDEVHKCIGIESFLSRYAMIQSMEAKRNHVAAVLLMQSLDTCDETEGIARLSSMSSQEARHRAHQVAVGYWNV